MLPCKDKILFVLLLVLIFNGCVASHSKNIEIKKNEYARVADELNDALDRWVSIDSRIIQARCVFVISNSNYKHISSHFSRELNGQFIKVEIEGAEMKEGTAVLVAVLTLTDIEHDVIMTYRCKYYGGKWDLEGFDGKLLPATMPSFRFHKKAVPLE